MKDLKQIYEKVFEFSPDAIVILNKAGKIIELNNRLEDWLGYEIDKIRGTNFASVPFLPDESKVIALENFKKRFAGDDIKPYTLKFVAKDGSYHAGRINAKTITDAHGEELDLIMISNTTEEQKAQMLLEKTMQYQKALSEIAIALNKGKDFDGEINFALKNIGTATQADRVYIFEDSADGISSSNSYEWVAKGIEPQIERLQKIPYESIPSWKKLLKKDGAILSENIDALPEDLRVILKPQGIKSILVLPLVDKDVEYGFIGLDITSHEKKWDESEINLLKTTAEVITASYQREQANEQIATKVAELEQMNKLMVGREIKMTELKQKIADLKE